MDKKIETRIGTLREEIVAEVCKELKSKVIQTWKDGADKLYNDAKSIVSEISKSPSEISRSRSVSKDFVGYASSKPKGNMLEYEAFPSDEEQSFKIQKTTFQPNVPEPKPFFGLKPAENQVVSCSPAFGESSNNKPEEKTPELTDKLD